MAKNHNQEFQNIDNGLTAGYNLLETYFLNKTGRYLHEDGTGLEASYILKECIAKAQFFQHTLGLGEGNQGLNHGLYVACDINAKNFSKEASKEMFDGFLHFIFANERDFNFLEYLIKQWIKDERSLTDTHDINGSQLTPLNMAILCNNVTAVTLLYQNGVNVTELDDDGFAPIHRIIAKIDNNTMDINVLKLWVHNKLPIDTKDKYGNDALFYAKQFNLPEAIKLLESSNEIVETDISSEQENASAVPKKDLTNEDLVNAILEKNLNLLKNVDSNSEIYGALWLFYNHDVINIDDIKQIIKVIPSELKFTHNAAMAFYNALIKQHKEFTQVLIDNGFNVNFNYPHPTIPDVKISLMDLAFGEIIKAIKNNDNFDAVINSRLKVIDFLIEMGAELDEADEARLLYITENDLDIIREIHSEKNVKHFTISNIEIKDSDLARAYIKNDLKTIKYLLNNDNLFVEIKIIDNKTRAPSDLKLIHIIELIRLVSHANQHYLIKDENIAKLILEKCVNDENVVQCLLYSLINKQEEFIEILIQNKVNINYNNSEILQTLVEAGINFASAINLAIKYGATITDKVLATAKTNGTFNIIENSSKLKKDIEQKLSENKGGEKKLTPSEKIKLLLELIQEKASDDDIKLKFGVEGNHFLNLAITFKNNPKILESLYIRHKIKVDFGNENSKISSHYSIELSDDIGTSLTGMSLEEANE
ncbi:MAG: ankyrin repeat domain-containing protein [Rickettsiales bacterium]|nr:MAG: ankyrin repeat domain-containing protein [Rickettsiales bacterium]